MAMTNQGEAEAVEMHPRTGLSLYGEGTEEV